MDIRVYYLQAESLDIHESFPLHAADWRCGQTCDAMHDEACRLFPISQQSEDAFEATCKVRGTPTLTTWLHEQACPSPFNCFKVIRILEQEASEFYDTRALISISSWSSIHTWVARNRHGTSKMSFWMNFSDVPNGFDLQIFTKETDRWNSVIMNCSASTFRFGKIDSIQWFYENHARKEVTLKSQPYLTTRRFAFELIMKNINVSNSGSYGWRVIGY